MTTTLGPSALEELGDQMVPGRWRSKIGDWIVRADRGATGRANSCWARGPFERDFQADIFQVEQWYRARSLPALFQVFAGNDPLVQALVDRGYAARSGAVVMTGPGLTLAGGPDLSWTVHDTIPDSLIELVGQEDRVVECTRAPRSRIVTADSGGTPVGGGLVVTHGRAAGIGLICTHQSHRRKGVASAVVGRLVEQANLLGADRFWLQVSPDNSAAIDLYRRIGFGIEHGYTYYVAPEAGLLS